MATIFDYLTWRGEIPLCDAAPLNEIDAVILSRFSNLPFQAVYHTKKETMGSFCRVMQNFHREKFQLDGDVPFVRQIAGSKRFSDLYVTDYIKDNNPELEMQFAAVTIHLPGDILFLSFCGTDSTLLGWKENLNMSFRDNIPAQCAALSYAAKALKQYPECKGLYMGGHSKGGNIATYAAVCLPEEYRHLVLGVYSCDGPGFSEDFISRNAFEEMAERVHTFLPTSSVVGRILEHAEEYELVQSTATSLYQHDLYTWVVEGPRLVRAEKSDDGSDIAYYTVRHLLEETTPEQRQFILDGVYSIVNATTLETPKEVSQEVVKLVPPLLKQVYHTQKDEWKTISEVFRAFGDAYLLAVRDVGIGKIPEELAELLTAENFQDAVYKLLRRIGA